MSPPFSDAVRQLFSRALLPAYGTSLRWRLIPLWSWTVAQPCWFAPSARPVHHMHVCPHPPTLVSAPCPTVQSNGQAGRRLVLQQEKFDLLCSELGAQCLERLRIECLSFLLPYQLGQNVHSTGPGPCAPSPAPPAFHGSARTAA